MNLQAVLTRNSRAVAAHLSLAFLRRTLQRRLLLLDLCNLIGYKNRGLVFSAIGFSCDIFFLQEVEDVMKIWKSYGSAHSTHLTIVGEFANLKDAEFAREIVEDFVNAMWEQRYPDNAAFIAAWKERLPALPFFGPNQVDFEMGLIDEPCEIEQQKQTVTVSRIRSADIGGIVKLMFLKRPTEVKISGITA
jgi:hypothetical protein